MCCKEKDVTQLNAQFFNHGIYRLVNDYGYPVIFADE
jgi:hypothetical protein